MAAGQVHPLAARVSRPGEFGAFPLRLAAPGVMLPPTMMAGAKFQTKASDRWSEQLTPWGVLDMALRGNRAQWWELYARARRDPELREMLRKMLPLADPELCGGKRLWLALLDRFDAEESPQHP